MAPPKKGKTTIKGGFGGFGGRHTHPRAEIDFARIATAAAANAESLLREWLPDGKRQGREWIARNPTRHDGKPGSFTVNLHSGRWADFATDDKGGDLIALRAYLDNCTQLEAARKVAAALGMAGTTQHYRRPAPTWEHLNPPPTGCPGGMPGTLRHPTRAEPSRAWMYTDKQGRPLSYACRFEKPDGGKDVIPYTWTGKGWEWKAMPEPRPLYRLPELLARKDAVVIICEGEKATARAAMLLPESVCTTWAGGCKAWGKTDWAPLKGRKVILWPDADLPGLETMKAIKTHLLNDVEAASVHLPTIPDDLPAGWDAADCDGRLAALRILAGKS
jgi:putative DNA primase/helicase